MREPTWWNEIAWRWKHINPDDRKIFKVLLGLIILVPATIIAALIEGMH